MQDDLKERLQLIAELSGRLTSSDVASIAKQAADRIAALTALIEHAGQDGVTEVSTQDALDFIGTAMRNWRHVRFDKEELEDFRVALQLRDARHRATAYAAGRVARDREIVEWLRELAAEYKRLRLTFQAADCNSIAGAIERGEV